MPKLYNIPRVGLFGMLAAFPDIQLSHAGSIWVTGFMSDELAAKVLDKYPKSISLVYP